MDNLYIIKIGGNIIDDEGRLSSLLRNFASIKGQKILVHGGGKMATRMAEQLNIPQQMVEGRRITDAETLKIVTMVYAGYINKNIVAKLQSNNCNAIGLSGADADAIRSHRRISSLENVDYGFAGDVDNVNHNFIHYLLQQEIIPVLSPITHDGKGQLLNTNADTIAQETAKSMCSMYNVVLIYLFEKEGVLKDVDDDSSLISKITKSDYIKLRQQHIISVGMIPKLDNAFAALDSGVNKVIIGKAEKILQLIEGVAGTSIVNE
jgi:acetylglutamate kinase